MCLRKDGGRVDKIVEKKQKQNMTRLGKTARAPPSLTHQKIQPIQCRTTKHELN